MLSWSEMQSNSIAFSKEWEDGKKEKQQGQSFMRDLLSVFDVEKSVIDRGFEYAVEIDKRKKYIDFFCPELIAIEMKSRGKDLDEAYHQLYNYMANLPKHDVPDLWLICDFENMHVIHHPTNQVIKFKTKDLCKNKNIKQFAAIAGFTSVSERPEQVELNRKAAENMAKLHIALKKYGYTGHVLQVYLVRLLFCMFADSANIFHNDIFFNYINNSKKDGSDLSDRLAKLFDVLDTHKDVRKTKSYISDELKRFEHINGKLFKEVLPPVGFTADMRKLLLECIGFDWSDISPAIFGAMFQGVMDDEKEQRRKFGVHYTSEENILKLINPLFLNDLWYEFEQAKTSSVRLETFHNKIANLRFLDPACGCGNFLIVTYRELRKLEIEIIKIKQVVGQLNLGMELEEGRLLKVRITQFYGIELDDFACQVATVGMWLVDHQMNIEVSKLIGSYYARLPLTESATIEKENALRVDWNTIINKSKLSYILGNPPFNGAREMRSEQKADIQNVFKGIKGVGNLDYVTAWYVKAAQYIINTKIRCAFVSTNSICQGEQVALLWKPLMETGIYINFGIPTFKWGNDAKGKAAVHCIIVSFSYIKTTPNINPYLIVAPTIFIDSRRKPICTAPQMNFGNMPNDSKGLLSNYTPEQKKEVISQHPETEKWFRRIYGAEEFIHNIERWCLWLVGSSSSDRTKSVFLEKIRKTIENNRNKSSRKATQKLAETSYLFAEIRQPDTDYLFIPRHSSEKRKYIPIDFASPNIIAGDSGLIIPNATLYQFGILTSSVHMAWVRAVCGRLESRYRYSKGIVYNNFPWIENISDKKKEKIELLAEEVLKARAAEFKENPNTSFDDLYKTGNIPTELLKAHDALDKAVMKLYGFSDLTESEVVEGLMKLYKKLTETQLQLGVKTMSRKPKIKIDKDKLIEAAEAASQKHILENVPVKCPHCGFSTVPKNQEYNCPECKKEVKVNFTFE